MIPEKKKSGKHLKKATWAQGQLSLSPKEADVNMGRQGPNVGCTHSRAGL